MAKGKFNFFIIICLLMVYINRGIFIAMPETENSAISNIENKQEINSLLEWIIGLVNESDNQTDEDKGLPESYSLIKFVQPFVFQLFLQDLTLQKYLLSSTTELSYPLSEDIPPLVICVQIDHPPQV